MDVAELEIGSPDMGDVFERYDLSFKLVDVCDGKAHVVVFEQMKALEPVAYWAALRKPLEDERAKRLGDAASLAFTCQVTETKLCSADQPEDGRDYMLRTWRSLVECRHNHHVKVAEITQKLEDMPSVGRPVFGLRGKSYWVPLERRFTLLYKGKKITFMIVDPSAEPDDVVEPVTLNPQAVQDQLKDQQLGALEHADFCDRFKDGAETPVVWEQSLEAYLGEPEHMPVHKDLTRKRGRSSANEDEPPAKRQP
jgi:hypothetical protein